MTDFSTNPELLLGKDVRADEVTQFLASLDPKTKVKKKGGPLLWFSRVAGMSLNAALDSGRITDVFFYAEGSDRCKQYAGRLPHGLRFDMTRAEMNQAVGGEEGEDNGVGLVWERDDYALFLTEDKKTGKPENFCITGSF